MATCDSETTVFEKDTITAPKRQDAWKCYGGSGYVEFVAVYSNTEGRIKYKLPLSIVAKYLNVTQGTTYSTHTTSDYIFTLECTVVFWGFQSNAIKVQTCIEPVSTPTPTPTPVPQKGSISCITNPAGANVYIDDNTFWKVTNCLVPDVTPGYHKVGYSLTGYKDYVTTIHVAEGQTRVVSVNLVKIYTPTPTPTPSPTTGNISCITNPAGANVFIDDNTFWKVTNCLVPEVSIGYHKVGYTLAGYMDYVKTIYISAGETEIVSAILVKVHDEASIKCTCNVDAYVKIDGGNSYPTPHTFTRLIQGSYHTLLFDKQNYISQTKNVTANIGTIVHVNLVQESAMGFDITINIPGLSSNQNKLLWVEPVTKIPFTDTWIPSSVHGGITWERVTNKQYLARESSTKCDPQPNLYFPGSTNHLEPNKNYAVFVGDVILETFPNHLIFKTGSSTPVNVSIGEDHYDWLMDKTCDLLDISMTECKSTLESGILDVTLSAEDISIVLTGKSIYPPYDTKTPTMWNYLFAGLAFFPVGGTVKGIGKIGPKVAAAVKKGGPDLENFVRFNTWKSVRFPEKNITFLEVMWELKGLHLDEVTEQLYKGNLDQASALITKYLPEGINPNQCAKDLGAFTKELFDRLPDGMPQVLIRDAGLEKSFNMGIRNIVYSSIEPTKESLDIVRNTFTKVPATKTAFKQDITQILKDSEPTPEQVQRFIDTNKRMPEILEEIAKPSFRSNIAGYITKLTNTLQTNPLAVIVPASGVSILILLYVHKHGEELLGIDATVNDVSPNDISWDLKDKMGVVEANYWNVQNAEDAQNWTTFCIALAAYGTSINEYQTYVETHLTQLVAAGTYDTFKAFSNAYDIALSLKQEVHACGLPPFFSATINSYIDGDSIKIRYGSDILECRLVGINTPEDKGYTYSCTGNQEDFLVRRLTAYGKECIEETTWNVNEQTYDDTVYLLKSLLPINTVVVVKIDKNHEDDKYGRKLVVIERGNTNINTTMLRSGAATVFFYENNSHVNTTQYLAAEKIASDAKYGIWEFAEGTGSIKCISENETACKIWLDGGDTGEQTVNNQFILTNVLLGNHRIVFTKDKSGVTYLCGVDVTVSKNQTVDARCTLTHSGQTPTPTPCPNPTASFDMAPTSPEDGEHVSLDGTDSSPGTGHWITKFEWILDQVPIGTGIFHSFIAVAGDHILTLKTTNDCGNVDNATKSFSVSTPSCPKPTASFVNTPTSPEINEYMYVDASDSSGDPGADIQRFEWYIDDILISTGETTNFIFSVVGTKSLKLKVINTCGGSDTKTKYINVTEPSTPTCPNPTASFVMSPSSPNIHTFVNLNASDSKGGTGHSVSSYEWILDGSGIGYGVTQSFSATQGNHILQLKITNDCGNDDSITKTFDVGTSACPNPTASFVISPTSPKVGEDVIMDASASSPGSGSFITEYKWYINNTLIGMGKLQSFSARAGNFILKLEVINECANSDFISKSLSIAEPTPVPGKTGTIYCKSQNETACEIWLDNNYSGHKTVSNVYLLKDIPIGPHTIVFKKMIKDEQHACIVNVNVIENQQAHAECWLTAETLFPINFESNPLNAIITKQ